MAARERALLGVGSLQGAALVAKRAQVVRATSKSALLLYNMCVYEYVYVRVC